MADIEPFRRKSRWLAFFCLALLSAALTVQAVHVHVHQFVGDGSAGLQHCALCAISHAPVTPVAIPVIMPERDARIFKPAVLQAAAPFQPRIAFFSRPPPQA